MDFALLGTGHETLPLVNAIAGAVSHRLVAFWADDDTALEVLTVSPSTRRLASRAELMEVNGLEAVIVDVTDPESLEVAKQLAGNSVAVLLLPRALHGIEFIYQFGLIRDEQPDLFRLYPIRPLRLHPLVKLLREKIQSGVLERIHQIAWQREESVVARDQPNLLSKNQVDEALLEDADLLKVWAGEFDQITALESGDAEQGIMQATASLRGKDALAAQWSCRGTTGEATWQIAVVGTVGQITLSGGNDPSIITWKASQPSLTISPDTVRFDWGAAVLQDFMEGTTHDGAAERWANDLYRAYDLLEGAHRSLRRRRTVDLYFDTPSERSNFKSTMTAVGCSLLLLTLLTIPLGLGAGAIAKDLGLHPVVMQIVRILVFAPLFLFLILQVGVFLAKPAGGKNS